VSGVLTISFNVANRILHWIMNTRKEYVGILKLHAEVKLEDLKKVFSEFEAEIFQTPPQKAAVKRQIRKRRIYELKIIEIKGRYVLFRALTDAGTYIRKLCFDIGEALGVGASMVELRRTKSGSFTEEDAVTLNQLAYALHLYKTQGDEDKLYKYFVPVERAINDLPVIIVRESAATNLYKGAALTMPGVLCASKNLERNKEVLVYSQKGDLIEIAKAKKGINDILNSKSGIVAVPVRVLDPIKQD
jgi:H/ACA ribonucleoprotein complex subunit 4